jgi:DNA end-binding protein Ku
LPASPPGLERPLPKRQRSSFSDVRSWPPSNACFRLGPSRRYRAEIIYAPEAALVDLINQKRAGKTIRPKERPKGENVVDLMEALRKSVGRETAPAKAGKPVKKPRKAAAGQKEMLMPIQGKKPAKEAAAKKPATGQRRKSA